MADYSASPLALLLANRQKGYVGLHIEQGVPILDRDLNLLQDLITATVRQVVARYIGDGTAAGANGFTVQALAAGENSQDFRIGGGDGGRPGSALVGGIEVSIPAPVTYKSQPGLPPLTTPDETDPDPRIDTVYLDVSLAEVDGRTDPELTNSLDVGIQTSVRLKPEWAVRVAEGTAVPVPPAGHTFYPLATLRRGRGADTIDAAAITDLRQRRLTVSDLEQRLSLMEKTLLLPVFVAGPAPQFVPKSGVVNQPITVNGGNFDVGPISVRFGDLPATLVGAPSPKQLVARVPGGLTPDGTPVQVRLTVANPGGAAVSEDTFTVLAAPVFDAPGGQFGPVSGTEGTQVTLHGFNFNAAGAQVRFGTVLATQVGVPTNTRMVVQVPAGLVPAGTTGADVRITVTTSDDTVVSDDTFRAELDIPAPAFASPTQFIPRSGPDDHTVALKGTHFNNAPVTVVFETTAATIVGSPSANEIAVKVPRGIALPGAAKSVAITVTTAGGTVTSTDQFTVDNTVE